MNLKEKVRSNAFGCCEYCLSQEDYSPDYFSLEHINPISKSGQTVFQNLAFSCQGCNNRKYTFIEWADPLSGNIFPLYNPRKDVWSDHFKWADDYLIIIGLSPIGRATIDKLQLNRKNVVNLRKVLIASNLHPPIVSTE